MSWLYSRALVEAYSEATCSDGAPSAPSSGSPIPQAYCAPDKMTAFSRLSRFGMTCKPLTADLGADVLTWFRAVFPAKIYHGHGQARGLPERDQGSGWKCTESYPSAGLDMSLSKTSGTCDLGGLPLFEKCLEPLATKHETATSTPTIAERRKCESEPSYWRGGAGRQWCALPIAQNVNAARSLGAKLATSIIQSALALGHMQKRTAGDWSRKIGGLLPTPTCQDAKNNAGPSQYQRNTFPLNVIAGGPMNPTWVEWLMGWPLGWTDLKPLATDKWQQWKHSHGVCCPQNLNNPKE